jgi:hypothetical protein
VQGAGPAGSSHDTPRRRTDDSDARAVVPLDRRAILLGNADARQSSQAWQACVDGRPCPHTEFRPLGWREGEGADQARLDGLGGVEGLEVEGRRGPHPRHGSRVERAGGPGKAPRLWRGLESVGWGGRVKTAGRHSAAAGPRACAAPDALIPRLQPGSALPRRWL